MHVEGGQGVRVLAVCLVGPDSLYRKAVSLTRVPLLSEVWSPLCEVGLVVGRLESFRLAGSTLCGVRSNSSHTHL